MSSASRDLVTGSEPQRDDAMLRHLAWPLDQLADGLAELGRRAGLAPSAIDPRLIPRHIDHRARGEMDRYLRWLSDAEGMAADAVEAPAAAVEAMLEGSPPAVLRIMQDDEPAFILLLAAKGKQVSVLAPGGRPVWCATRVLRDAMLAAHIRPLRHEIGSVLSLLPLDETSRAASLDAIARARLGTKPIGGLWSLRLPDGAPFLTALRHHRVHWLALGLLAVFALSYLLEITGWRLMGETVLSGHMDFGWLLAWGLLLLSAVPVRYWGARRNAALTLAVSAIIKQRLLAGALNLDTAKLRHAGAGQILAQVLETQAFEALAVNGGVAAIVALIEIAIAGYILTLGAGAAFLLPLLVLWLLLIGGLGWRYYRRLSAWSDNRLDLTHDMVERMTGHRTVQAQEPAARREAAIDLQLKQFHLSSRALDDAVMPFLASLPSGWTIAALAALAPAFIAGSLGPSGLAIALGGILFAGRAINTICGGLAGLARAAVAWNKAAPLFLAAPRRRAATPFIPAHAARSSVAGTPVIDAHDLVFSHGGGAEAVIDGATLTIRPGERILLEGSSGGGKSTLAALLAGLRSPDSGLLLLNGFDRHTLGEAWHRAATSAPQFHENHIMTGPLAYNLLMGRRWPATAEDLAEARAVCEELGLGPLIERMPARLSQQVGETGWQLSHGEKSRIFLARALLQDAALTVLDESFAALDPETLKRAITCAASRSRTLMVIAHP